MNETPHTDVLHRELVITRRSCQRMLRDLHHLGQALTRLPEYDTLTRKGKDVDEVPTFGSESDPQDGDTPPLEVYDEPESADLRSDIAATLAARAEA